MWFLNSSEGFFQLPTGWIFQGPTFVAGLLQDPISEVESSEPSIDLFGRVLGGFFQGISLQGGYYRVFLKDLLSPLPFENL